MRYGAIESRDPRRRDAATGPSEDRRRLGAFLALFAAALFALAAMGGGEDLPGAGAPNLTEMAGPAE